MNRVPSSLHEAEPRSLHLNRTGRALCRSRLAAPRHTARNTSPPLGALTFTCFFLGSFSRSESSLRSNGASDRSSVSSGSNVLSTWQNLKLPNLSRGRFTMRRPLNPTTLRPTCFVNSSNVPTAPPIVDKWEASPVCR